MLLHFLWPNRGLRWIPRNHALGTLLVWGKAGGQRPAGGPPWGGKGGGRDGTRGRARVSSLQVCLNAPAPSSLVCWSAYSSTLFLLLAFGASVQDGGEAGGYMGGVGEGVKNFTLSNAKASFFFKPSSFFEKFLVLLPQVALCPLTQFSLTAS